MEQVAPNGPNAPAFLKSGQERFLWAPLSKGCGMLFAMNQKPTKCQQDDFARLNLTVLLSDKLGGWKASFDTGWLLAASCCSLLQINSSHALIALRTVSVSTLSSPKSSEPEPHLMLQTLTLVICSAAGFPLSAEVFLAFIASFSVGSYQSSKRQGFIAFYRSGRHSSLMKSQLKGH